MGYLDTLYSDSGLQSYWDTAATLGGDREFEQVRGSGTATMNAIQSAQPIDDTKGFAWEGWLSGVGDKLMNYAAVREMSKAQTQQQQSVADAAAAQAYAARQQAVGFSIAPGTLMMLGLGVVVFLVARKL